MYKILKGKQNLTVGTEPVYEATTKQVSGLGSSHSCSLAFALFFSHSRSLCMYIGFTVRTCRGRKHFVNPSQSHSTIILNLFSLLYLLLSVDVI